jgi:hypothetical protein
VVEDPGAVESSGLRELHSIHQLRPQELVLRNVETNPHFLCHNTGHTNLRPTILELAGLKDDYVQDGRVLIEAIRSDALPESLRTHRETLLRLGAVYEQVNAPFGQFNQDVLKASTRALKSGSASIKQNRCSIRRTTSPEAETTRATTS